MVDELDREHLNLTVLLESAHTNVVSLGDVEKDAVDEEEEGLDVQELAPAEAEIEEEFS